MSLIFEEKFHDFGLSRFSKTASFGIIVAFNGRSDKVIKGCTSAHGSARIIKTVTYEGIAFLISFAKYPDKYLISFAKYPDKYLISFAKYPVWYVGNLSATETKFFFFPKALEATSTVCKSMT